MHCPNCKEEISEGKKFCGHCGFRLQPKPGFDDEAPTRLEATPAVPIPSSEPPKPAPVEIRSQVSQPGDEMGKPENPSQPKRLSYLLAWLIIILGWGIGGFLGFLGFGSEPMIGKIITSLIWGLSLALAFGLSGLTKGIANFLMILAGWLLAGILVRPPILNIPQISYGLLLFIGFPVGGLISALVLKRTETAIHIRHVLIITLIWFFGSFPGIIIAGRGSMRPEWIFRFDSGAWIGAICGGLTLLVVSRVSDGIRNQSAIIK
jgi:hypothetical protein